MTQLAVHLTTAVRGGWATCWLVRCTDSLSTAKVLAPYVRQGMTALEPGPGMGFFTLELARLVSREGRVVAVDIQSRMLDGLRRAARAGVLNRLAIRLATPGSMASADSAGVVDFTLALVWCTSCRFGGMLNGVNGACRPLSGSNSVVECQLPKMTFNC